MQARVSLRPLRAEELADFRASFIEDWASDLSRTNDISLADARLEAARRTEADLSEGNNKPGQRLSVITLDGQTVGRLWVSIANGVAFLEDITVDPESRGHGIGRRVLELLDLELRALDVSRVELSVDAGNSRAKALYEHVGYEVTGFRMMKRL